MASTNSLSKIIPLFNKCAALFSTYEASFSACLFSILDNAKSAGIELVDFGNGDEPYKRWFATGSLCSISGISL